MGGGAAHVSLSNRSGPGGACSPEPRVPGATLQTVSQGSAPERSECFFGHGSIESNVLLARVRACLGRVVSHPSAINVSLTEPQRVLLRGSVLAWEHGPLLRAVSAVPGVRGVQEQLAVHESAEQIFAQQDGRACRTPVPLLLRPHGSRGTRLATAAAGGGLLWGGLTRRGPWGALGALPPAVCCCCVASGMVRLLGSNGARRTVPVRKTLHIRASVARVFDALCDCENFPQLMRTVRTVQRLGDGSTYWRLTGPLGLSLEWNAIATQLDKDRLLAWRTLGESPLQHSGLARFEAEDGGTRLQVDLWYRPPAGQLGHALAQLLDSKSELDAELLRLKTYLENSRPARDGVARRVR